jgi:hypothetical protein
MRHERGKSHSRAYDMEMDPVRRSRPEYRRRASAPGCGRRRQLPGGPCTRLAATPLPLITGPAPGCVAEWRSSISGFRGDSENPSFDGEWAAPQDGGYCAIW